MDPLKYYNFKNSLELNEMLEAGFYHFKAVFNGGFISGMYSFNYNAIVEPIFGAKLTEEERSEITAVLKDEVVRLMEKEEL